ncbi:AbiV family abortive infection protein [Streptomyces sp. NPDC020794]|uniref:AbiV family abortive infection protein n=1 Tax=unclassified Streptomyces TaxID=2593676 RepID=UPI0036E6226D
MTTTALYEIETAEAAEGTPHPVEQIWSPGEDAKEHGFLSYGGLYITGIGGSGDDDAYPAALRQLAAAAQGNAADLAAEARILLEASRFARAHALATLALEELGKQALCHEALAGKLDERGFRQAWSNHLAKLERSRLEAILSASTVDRILGWYGNDA